MPTKAIYTKNNGVYYKVNQPTANPNNIVRVPKTHATMTLDNAEKQVNSTVWISNIDPKAIKTNRESFVEMTNDLRIKQTTKIDTVQNNYVLYCDYSVLDDNGKIINHNVVTRPLMANDGVYILGVDKNGILEYKQVKMLEGDISCTIRQEYPYGIMKNVSANRYVFQLNDVAIYQDLTNDISDIHNSVNIQDSLTIADVLKYMMKVYSTYDNGISISAVEVPFIPKSLSLKFHVALDNIIVVYDSHEINDILDENIIDTDDTPPGEVKVIILNGGNATPEISDDTITE